MVAHPSSSTVYFAAFSESDFPACKDSSQPLFDHLVLLDPELPGVDRVSCAAVLKVTAAMAEHVLEPDMEGGPPTFCGRYVLYVELQCSQSGMKTLDKYGHEHSTNFRDVVTLGDLVLTYVLIQ